MYHTHLSPDTDTPQYAKFHSAAWNSPSCVKSWTIISDINKTNTSQDTTKVKTTENKFEA